MSVRFAVAEQATTGSRRVDGLNQMIVIDAALRGIEDKQAALITEITALLAGTGS